MITAILVMIVIIVCLIAALVAVIWGCMVKIKGLKKDIGAYKELIKKQGINLQVLQDYHTASEEIRKKRNKIVERIKEAKTDEEVHKVIIDIIDYNNSRLPNH